MKRWRIFTENLGLSVVRILSIFLGMTVSLLLEGTETSTSLPFMEEEQQLSSKPLYEVATLGAPTTGSLIEGSVGALNKGRRQRFYCHSADPQEGFLGPQAIAKPLAIKDQPGVFPAPLMGPASLTFHFSCQNPEAFLTPLVVRPDGTVFHGFPITSLHSSQTLEISSPAQTGIYTLFVVAHQKESEGVQVKVDATVSTQPERVTTFQLKSFTPHDKDAALISAEFIYD